MAALVLPEPGSLGRGTTAEGALVQSCGTYYIQQAWNRASEHGGICPEMILP
jgi:hypothetical protein